jgi:hypothetical protein
MRTWAIVVNTNQPVYERFADNLCTFCTGLPTKLGEAKWEERFFREMSIGYNDQVKLGTKPVWNNPFCRNSKRIWHQSYLTPCRPWSTAGWASNDKGIYVDLSTLRNSNGCLISEREIFEQYTHPAKMSVAIFFSKEVHSLLFEIIANRSRVFIQEYGTNHNITSVGSVELDFITD